MADVLVLVDHDGGKPKKVTNQILTAARTVGEGLEVGAAVFGEGASAAAEQLGAYGVAEAYVWDSADADAYATEARVRALQAAMDFSGADVLLYATDPFTTDVVARTAVRMEAGVVTDCIDLSLDGDRWVGTKAIFGGEMTSRCQVRGDRPQFFGVKANAFTAEEVGGAPPEVIPLEVELTDTDRRARGVALEAVLGRAQQQAGGPGAAGEGQLRLLDGREGGEVGGRRDRDRLQARTPEPGERPHLACDPLGQEPVALPAPGAGRGAVPAHRPTACASRSPRSAGGAPCGGRRRPRSRRWRRSGPRRPC